ncbi:MAG TPA: efflux RND transporter periplasmic adaptor subunit [Pirellulales bacterium]|nr:efflux RND transporter periplasmic adaptor subunit [Pirellulales bacterium]
MMRILIVGVLAAVAGAAATWLALRELDESKKAPRPAEKVDDDCLHCDEKDYDVVALARLEPKNGVISINGTPGDRLVELRVSLDDVVKKGDTLARVESYGLREAELELAETQLEEAGNRKTAEEAVANANKDEADIALEQARLYDLDKQAQQTKVDGLQDAYETSLNDLKRLTDLRHTKGSASGEEIVSEQQLAHQQLATDKARNELKAANDELVKLQKSADLAYRQAQAKQKTAQANFQRIPSLVQIATLEKQKQLAQRKKESAEIKAPCDGKILKIFLNQGDTLTQQPILQMADTSEMVAIAEVYEDDVRRIALDDEACIESCALAAILTGHVKYIGNMVAKNTVVGLDPTASTDKRVVETRILLDKDAGKNSDARTLINLQVTTRIRVKSAPTDRAPAEAP